VVIDEEPEFCREALEGRVHLFLRVRVGSH
jgi:hypothetical protein